MSEDPDSNDRGPARPPGPNPGPGPGPERPARAKLPERRTPTVLPERRHVPPHPHEGERPAEPLRPVPPPSGRKQSDPGGASKLKKVLLVVGGLAATAGIIYLLAPIVGMVATLDTPKSGPQEVDGGMLYWMSDGVVAVHLEEETGRKVYYVVEAPRETNPRVTFNGSVMSLQVSTEGGMKTISRGSKWDLGPQLVYFTYKNSYREAAVLVGDFAYLDTYLAASATGAPIAGFLPKFRRVEFATPPPGFPAPIPAPAPAPTPTPFPAPAPSPFPAPSPTPAPSPSPAPIPEPTPSPPPPAEPPSAPDQP